MFSLNLHSIPHNDKAKTIFCKYIKKEKLKYDIDKHSNFSQMPAIYDLSSLRYFYTFIGFHLW